METATTTFDGVTYPAGTPHTVRYENITAILASAIQELGAEMHSVLSWFAGGMFHVQGNVCVDDTCVTKEQFKQMLINAGAAPRASGGNASIPSTDSLTTSTPSTVASDTITVSADVSTTTPPQDTDTSTEGI